MPLESSNVYLPPKNDDPPFNKILAIVLGIFILLGGALKLYGDHQNTQEAEKFYAVAKDDIRSSNLDQALKSIKRAILLKEQPKYLEEKANLEINLNKISEARETLKRLVALEPDNAHYLYLAGMAFYNEVDYENAVEYLKKASQKEPDNLFYQTSLANLILRQGKVDEALAMYEDLVQKNPNYETGWDHYITSLNYATRHQEALAVTKRAMQIFKNSSNFYFLKGESEYYLSLKKDAVTSYYRSLELEPLSNSIAAERILELTGKRPPSKLENLETDRIPFTSDNNLMFIEALVNNRLGLFLVDTGASGCVLFSNQLEKYRMKTGTSKIEAETAGGTIQARIAFGRVQVGKHIVEPIMFVVTPPPKSMRADGIIGMNFLNRFQMDINRDTQVITLKR